MTITNIFYENAVEFTKTQIRRLGGKNIEAYDVLHDVIASPDFNEDSWKQDITGRIKILIASGSNLSIGGGGLYKQRVEERYCKKCDESYPEQYFISGFNKNTKRFQYRTICRKCHYSSPQKKEQFRKWYLINKKEWNKKNREYRKTHSDTTAKERQKRFAKKQKEELGDWYVKKLLTRHKYKASEVTPEMIEEKRKQVLKMREDGNWRTTP